MIKIDIDKAKQIGHEIRRKARNEEFAPLDALISKQIPGSDIASIEIERQAIREKYAIVQEEIDLAETPDQIKQALGI